MKNTNFKGKLRCMTAIYLTCGEQILLLYRQGGRVVNNVWVASAGGHFEEYELNDASACVLRELWEELGIAEEELENLSLRYVTLRRTEGELRQNYHFFAELKDGTERKLQSDEGILQWFSFEELEDLTMSYAAHYVLEHWVQEGQFTNKVYGGISNKDTMIIVDMPAF